MAKIAIPESTFDPDLLVGGSAKKALETISATKGELYYASPDELVEIPGFNVRVETPEYLEHIEQIALSIQANGFYPNKPLGGFAGKLDGADVIYITDGYSRRRAILRARELGAEIDKIPVVLKAQGTTIEDLTVALVQDNEGRPLTAMEKAIVAARLRGFNMTNVEIAQRFGCTDRYVEDLLVLAGAPKKVRDFVIAGKVSPTEAIKQVRKNPERAGDVLLVAVQTAAGAGKSKATSKHVKAAGTIVAKLTATQPTTVSADEDIRVDAPETSQDAPETPAATPVAPKPPKAAGKAPTAAKKATAKKTTVKKPPMVKATDTEAPAPAGDAGEFAGL